MVCISLSHPKNIKKTMSSTSSLMGIKAMTVSPSGVIVPSDLGLLRRCCVKDVGGSQKSMKVGMYLKAIVSIEGTS